MKKLIASAAALMIVTGVFAPTKLQLFAQDECCNEVVYEEPAPIAGRRHGTAQLWIAAGVAVAAAIVVIAIASHDHSDSGH